MDGCYLGFDMPGSLSYRLLNSQGLVTEQVHTLPLENGLSGSPRAFDRDALIVEGSRQAGSGWPIEKKTICDGRV